MYIKPLPLGAAMSAAALLSIAACGGGGGSNAVSNITLSGTAATGAPLSGATAVVVDSTGAEMQACAPCTVPDNGQFVFELKPAAKGPFVLKFTQEGLDEPLVSMIDTAKSARVNVSPLTTLIAARLAANGDPTTLSASDLSEEKIQQAMAEVRSALKPVLDAAGVAADENPLSMNFSANSSGLDKALDILGTPKIVRGSDGKASVEVEIKTSGSDDAPDASNSSPKITLNKGIAPAVSGLTQEKITAALPSDGLSQKIKGLLGRIQACYALAPADRRPAGAKLATEITADTCKAIFVDNNPSKFLHNNTVVSHVDAILPTDMGGRFSGAFNGFFNNVRGIAFDLPEYRYTIRNGNTTDSSKPMEGDVVFTARWTVTDPNAGPNLGQTDVGEYQARIQGDELKLVGNQSKHDLNINAQARREEMPAVSDYAYLATGYNINVTERKWNHDSNATTPKVSIYEQVVVSAPTGKSFTFKPIPGNNYGYLGLVGTGGKVSASATVRLSGTYLNAATAGLPSERFTKEFWAPATDWSDEKLAAIPNQGNWKFDITLTDDFVAANAANGTQKNSTQYRRSINRAPTVAELKAMKWPALKDPTLTSLSEAATGLGFVSIGSNNAAAALVVEGWSVDKGAWAPTRVKVYGSTWDEGLDVASTKRKATIPCTGSGNHCEKSNQANTEKFVNAQWNYLQFTGRDNKRLQMSLNYSTRKTNADSQ
ncbi:MAG: hypothetical protein QE265_10800 [Rhodoferax sp.]|nr:hypothetical protein [Rhodoferax sp.]